MILFERSEFLIDTSQKKSLRVCTCARVHACSTNLGFNVWYYVQHTWYVRTWYQLVISPLPRYVYVSTYVPGWGTYCVPHMFVNWCEHVFCTWHQPAPKIRICRYVCTRDTKDTRALLSSSTNRIAQQRVREQYTDCLLYTSPSPRDS